MRDIFSTRQALAYVPRQKNNERRGNAQEEQCGQLEFIPETA
jgi:hypothetical protein